MEVIYTLCSEKLAASRKMWLVYTLQNWYVKDLLHIYVYPCLVLILTVTYVDHFFSGSCFRIPPFSWNCAS